MRAGSPPPAELPEGVRTFSLPPKAALIESTVAPSLSSCTETIWPLSNCTPAAASSAAPFFGAGEASSPSLAFRLLPE